MLRKGLVCRQKPKSRKGRKCRENPTTVQCSQSFFVDDFLGAVNKTKVGTVIIISQSKTRPHEQTPLTVSNLAHLMTSSSGEA